MPRAISNIRLGLARPMASGPSAPSFSPADVAGLVSWWDADDASSLVLVGGNVTVWANQVSGGPSLQPYAAAPQIPSTAVASDRTWIDFDVTNSEALRVIDPADTDILFGSGEISIFVAFRTTRTVAQTLLNKGSNVGGRYRMRLNHATAGDMQGVIHDGSTNVAVASGDVGSDDGATHVMAYYRDNTADLLRVRLDNANEQTGSTAAIGDIDETSGAAFVAQLIVGAQPSGAGLNSLFDGLIGEILMYNTYIDGDDRAAIEAYLAAKWGA